MKLHKTILAASAALLINLSQNVDACTRFTYEGLNNEIIVGRSMDWVDDLKTDLWAFPAGIKKEGAAGANSINWTSKYGSVIASGYNAGATDGINEKGLAANLLYLSGSDYGNHKSNKQDLSLLLWTQYMLDNYATVDEAVKNFTQDKINIVAPKAMNGHKMDLHLSITDPSGDNAIFEYVNGKLVVHHGKQYTVMTNEPTYDKQLALNDYWQGLKGKFLPGTETPEDRFVRTAFYLNEAGKTSNNADAIATVFSIARNASVPLGKASKERPNLCPTIWRTVADLKNNVYYFEETNKPNVFWVDIKKINLKAGAKVKKLSLSNGEVYAGETSAYFKEAKPYETPDISKAK